MQIMPQYALIVQEAVAWAWWISHCQSIWNWICHIMLCQLFLCIHLTDKTIIKLMQCSRQNSLAERLEMKPLSGFLPRWTQNPTSPDCCISHVRHWRVLDKAGTRQPVCTPMRMMYIGVFPNMSQNRKEGTSGYEVLMGTFSVWMQIYILSRHVLSAAAAGGGRGFSVCSVLQTSTAIII